MLVSVCVSVSCGQVMVTGLPKSATEDEVLEHFNNLYDLSREDWTFKVGQHACALLSRRRLSCVAGGEGGVVACRMCSGGCVQSLANVVRACRARRGSVAAAVGGRHTTDQQ